MRLAAIDHDIDNAMNSLSRRASARALATIGCALALAACGSSDKPHTTASTDHNLGVQFANCMRTHGVPNFPGPISGPGVRFPIDFETMASSPAFQGAQRACQHLLPARIPPTESTSQTDAAFKYAQCMRTHGAPNYPDPTDTNGHQIPQPLSDYGINPQSPAFLTTAKACQAL